MTTPRRATQFERVTTAFDGAGQRARAERISRRHPTGIRLPRRQVLHRDRRLAPVLRPRVPTVARHARDAVTRDRLASVLRRLLERDRDPPGAGGNRRDRGCARNRVVAQCHDRVRRRGERAEPGRVSRRDHTRVGLARAEVVHGDRRDRVLLPVAAPTVARRAHREIAGDVRAATDVDAAERDPHRGDLGARVDLGRRIRQSLARRRERHDHTPLASTPLRRRPCCGRRPGTCTSCRPRAR